MNADGLRHAGGALAVGHLASRGALLPDVVKCLACWLVIAVAGTGIPRPAVAQYASAVRSLFEQRGEHVIRQQYDLSCGAAALATILKYQHGEAVDERQVALGLISRDVYLAKPELLRQRQGFSLLDMKRYVGWRGYDGEALGGLSLDDLAARAPAIVPIRQYGYSHFVVFRGVLGSNVLLGDPAFGNRTMPVERFIASWIDYPMFGRVAFAVRRRDNLIAPNRLTVSERDFPILMPNNDNGTTPP